MRAVFIRAPWIEECGPCVEVLATCRDRIVAAREGGVLVTAFHPELTDDTRLHELFIHMIRRRHDAAAAAQGAAADCDAVAPGRAAAAAGHR